MNSCFFSEDETCLILQQILHWAESNREGLVASSVSLRSITNFQLGRWGSHIRGHDCLCIRTRSLQQMFPKLMLGAGLKFHAGARLKFLRSCQLYGYIATVRPGKFSRQVQIVGKKSAVNVFPWFVLNQLRGWTPQSDPTP